MTNAAITSATSDIQLARETYVAIRRKLIWSAGVTAKQFDDAARSFLSGKGVAAPAPADWVIAAREALVRCGRCAGTGMFVTRVENGEPKGPGGACYRCGGKGLQNEADARRNNYHDIHQIVRH